MITYKDTAANWLVRVKLTKDSTASTKVQILKVISLDAIVNTIGPFSTKANDVIAAKYS